MQDNKENNILLDPGENGSLALPQTPIHSLKRTQSNVLKPEDNSPEKRSRSVSPVRRQARLPLASKDRNKSGAAGPLRKRQPTLQGDLLSNPRKLKKYGSVLGYTDLPRPKSLVLKDGDEGGDEDGDEGGDEDDEEEEEESGELQKKLEDAMSRRDDSTEGLGGLSKLIQDTKDDIEYAPRKIPPLEYVPDGHAPWDEKDIEKLKKVDLSVRESRNDSEDAETDDGDDGLLPLMDLGTNAESLNEDETDELPSRGKKIAPSLVRRPFEQVKDDVENNYRGEGLNAEELEDLLK